MKKIMLQPELHWEVRGLPAIMLRGLVSGEGVPLYSMAEVSCILLPVSTDEIGEVSDGTEADRKGEEMLLGCAKLDVQLSENVQNITG